MGCSRRRPTCADRRTSARSKPRATARRADEDEVAHLAQVAGDRHLDLVAELVRVLELGGVDDLRLERLIGPDLRDAVVGEVALVEPRVPERLAEEQLAVAGVVRLDEER